MYEQTSYYVVKTQQAPCLYKAKGSMDLHKKDHREARAPFPGTHRPTRTPDGCR